MSYKRTITEGWQFCILLEKVLGENCGEIPKSNFLAEYFYHGTIQMFLKMNMSEVLTKK
jgi:hypothetical protein